LKPENIFVTSDGLVKVLDFGIARLREGSGSEGGDATRTGAMLGTPAFMAPEQARSRWEWVDAKTDLWAIGATMFTTLSGEFVHKAETATELLVAAATQRALPLRSSAPDVPASVAAIVDRALEFEKADRWQDARAMQSAIAAVMRDRAEVTTTTVLGHGPPREPAAALSAQGPLPEAKPVRKTVVMSGQERGERLGAGMDEHSER
jgi:serine/threonine-protein kinase